jgi:mRNA interferase MazF
VAREVNRGEIWRYRFHPPDKKRPVVVLSRQEVIPLLHTVMVAPITSAVRGAARWRWALTRASNTTRP